MQVYHSSVNIKIRYLSIWISSNVLPQSVVFIFSKMVEGWILDWECSILVCECHLMHLLQCGILCLVVNVKIWLKECYCVTFLACESRPTHFVLDFYLFSWWLRYEYRILNLCNMWISSNILHQSYITHISKDGSGMNMKMCLLTFGIVCLIVNVNLLKSGLQNVNVWL